MKKMEIIKNVEEEYLVYFSSIAIAYNAWVRFISFVKVVPRKY